jgi:osmotically-inducible protein OsmY
MKSDAQLKRDVIAELEWDSAIDAAHVGVAVREGIVTLSGHIDNHAEKHAIEQAVRRVQGVSGIALEVDVRLDPAQTPSDSEIAAAVESAFRWNTLIPHDRILVKVEKGWLTLTGEVDWEYQRQNAATAVHALQGVVGVSNAITLKPRKVEADIAQGIRAALIRHAAEASRRIEVIADGGEVILRGQVDSWAERAEAVAAAWAAPGVHTVTCELDVPR